MKKLFSLLLIVLVISSCTKTSKLERSIKGSYKQSGTAYSTISTYCSGNNYSIYGQIPVSANNDYTQGKLIMKGTYEIINDTIVHTKVEAPNGFYGTHFNIHINDLNNLQKIETCKCNCE
jgi:hypothetical protein